MSERQPSIIREGGYQGSGDPGKPTALMQPQTKPIAAPPAPVSAKGKTSS